MIRIERAPAFATVQDGGRRGHRRSGVPPGGAMDLDSLRLGNALLGNDLDAAALEWALTAGSLRFQRPLQAVVTGAVGSASLNGEPLVPHAVFAARTGDTLAIDRPLNGRFLYVCVGGGLAVPEILGARGTYLPAGFGGQDGRRVKSGDNIPTGDAGDVATRPIDVPPQLLRRGEDPLMLLAGPQTDVIGEAGFGELLREAVAVSPESDRSGYRLLRARETRYRADAPSEPACVGAVQLTPDGNLIVLMPDGPTVGGYPKVAVVASCDLPRLAQKLPGESVRFRGATIAEAQSALRARNSALRGILALTRGQAQQ